MQVLLMRAFLRSSLRGRTRIPPTAARYLKSLRSVPIVVEGLSPYYVDLRDADPALLAGSPWQVAPVEHDERAVMRRVVRKGDVCFDIGAHTGAHSVLLSALAARVILFEPNPRMLPCLRLTVADLPNATLRTHALGESEGELTLHIPPDASMASLRDWTGYSGVSHLPVRVLRLDDCDLPHPDFIKCDVEGGELAVFRGAYKILNRKDAPIILFEAHRESAKSFGYGMWDAKDFLAELPEPEYRFYEVVKNGSGELSELSEPESGWTNVLAVPASRAERL